MYVCTFAFTIVLEVMSTSDENFDCNQRNQKSAGGKKTAKNYNNKYARNGDLLMALVAHLFVCLFFEICISLVAAQITNVAVCDYGCKYNRWALNTIDAKSKLITVSCWALKRPKCQIFF